MGWEMKRQDDDTKNIHARPRFFCDLAGCTLQDQNPYGAVVHWNLETTGSNNIFWQPQ
jgi:hypothetical protein